MGDKSAIEWLASGATWNPIRARAGDGSVGWYCAHVSPGCVNCYAEHMNRWRGNGAAYVAQARPNLEIYLDQKTLEQPLHWRKPRKIFPCSMTDLFGEWVTYEWLDRILNIMYRTPQHTYIVLTKRADRMADWMDQFDRPLRGQHHYPYGQWPPKNVWLGVSVEDQQRADERIPHLLATPAAVRFLSCEPLLGPIDLKLMDDYIGDPAVATMPCHSGRLDWVIVGGESGPAARPMHPAWARSIRDQCAAANVPFFFKQWGEFAPYGVGGALPTGRSEGKRYAQIRALDEHTTLVRCGKARAGRVLDGREWNEFPHGRV